MQRRAKSGLYISPPDMFNGASSSKKSNYDLPVDDNSPYSSSSEKFPSRLNQRTLGLTHRIWIILAIIAFIVLFSNIMLPSDTHIFRGLFSFSSSFSENNELFDTSTLKPINYMNATDGEPNPFPFCPLHGPGDEIGAKYGLHTMKKTMLHSGSGARVQRVVHKAMLGLPITISVLGGSVSACHGSGDDPISPKCYPSRFFRWWNSIFPNPGTELTNGAIRRTNSAYLGYCHKHHLPDVTDIVILELDADDRNEPIWLEHFELLVRSILIRPEQPAVVIFGHFSPQVGFGHGFNGPESLHSVVAQFYDLPHVSIKPILYEEWISSPQKIAHNYADAVLANPTGHEVLADTLIHYFQSQICEAWDAATGYAFDVASPVLLDDVDPGNAGEGAHGLFGGVGFRQGIEDEDGRELPDPQGPHERLASMQQYRVPEARIRSRPHQHVVGSDDEPPKFNEVKPFCAIAHDLITPLPPSLFLGSGWNVHHPTGAGNGGSAAASSSHYWYATLPTSKLRIPIVVSAGDVGVYYLREPRRKKAGIVKDGDEEVDEEGSSIECWVDDNYGGKVEIWNIIDNVGEPTATLEIIDANVSPGSHFVECQLTGEEGQPVFPFRLVGIFAT